MTEPVPEPVRRFRVEDVSAQRIRWLPDRWTAAFAVHEKAHADLTTHSDEAGGIARHYIHAHAGGDPVELFLITMAWGYKPKDYGPHRVQTILATDGAVDRIRAIVEMTRSDGAAAGWHALLNTQKIIGLNISFGTKLLYFAGYTTHHRPRPLVLDEKVRASLHRLASGIVPQTGTVHRADYLRYLHLAERWASDPEWRKRPM
ncbi:MAG: hypothetical protein ACLQHS_03895 [Candidatus Limnocylindrales bacterium]